ncbi:MAG: ABC transporter ATP-binding protein/permease [Myxococcales bacterium]|nr:ABC transporter ATP-binding protein/permease [Myxococcales bacterium]
MRSMIDATPTDEEQNHWQTLRTLSGHLWPGDRKDLQLRVIVALVCLVGARLVSVYIPVIYKDAVDALSPKDMALVLPLAVIVSYGLARLSTTILGELRDFVFVRVSQHAQRGVALNTFKHLHHLSLRFHLDRQTGGLSRVIERALRGMQFVLSFMLFNILPTMIELVLVMAILSYYFDYRYPIVTGSTVVIYIAFTFIVTEWRLKFRKEMNDKDSAANTKAIDSLLNFETVKYFSNENHEYARYDASLAGYESAAVKSQRSLSILNVGQATIISAGVVILMYMAASGVVAGDLSIGDFVMANTYMMQLFMPLNFLGFVYREMKRGFIDMDKLFELLHVDAEVQDAPESEGLAVDGGRIEFDHVTFAYNDDRTILDDVSFVAEAGQTVAIVGPSGSGKSTVARLLFRFYDPQGGAIRIDGQDLKSVTQASVRSNIGVVPQDTVLFNDSIGYNIEYGRPGASEEEIAHAAKMAQIQGFIADLSEGFDTPVGERGLKLSGGEKQRVAIARTILKDPPILILDEATSALDTHTEQEIQQSLDEVSRGRTTVVVAHRLSTIVDADLILVLDGGRIVEQGTHAELVAAAGAYFSMWHQQQRVQEVQAQLREIA